MASPPQSASALDRIPLFLERANTVIVGKDRELRLTLCCLLAGGHLLIEDIPGTGKTTLVKVFAKLLGLPFNRVQFTNDMLPADLLGTTIYDESAKSFSFHPGPIFASLVLGDELNRASPKTQSACLQVMEEAEITLDGQTHVLPKPFYLLATQNPRLHVGTYPLPESQLDRFLMRMSLGFPDRDAERSLLRGESRALLIERMTAVYATAEVLALQQLAQAVHLAAPIVEYVLDLVAASRQQQGLIGLSPRAAIGLLQASKAWALIHLRQYVIPEDIQAVAVAVMGHRLVSSEEPDAQAGRNAAERLMASVAVP